MTEETFRSRKKMRGVVERAWRNSRRDICGGQCLGECKRARIEDRSAMFGCKAGGPRTVKGPKEEMYNERRIAQ